MHIPKISTDFINSFVTIVALGDVDFVINPFQVICPVCVQIVVLSGINQLRALLQHLREKHDTIAADIVLRLKTWMNNDFVTHEQMDERAELRSTVISPAAVLSNTCIRAAVLARDILKGHFMIRHGISITIQRLDFILLSHKIFGSELFLLNLLKINKQKFYITCVYRSKLLNINVSL